MKMIAIIGALVAASCAPQRTHKEAAVAVADEENIEFQLFALHGGRISQ